MEEGRIKKLCDAVRETGFAIHRFLGPGHLERVYETSLHHRLCLAGFSVERQKPLEVRDEDGTVLGEYLADLCLENCLLVEIKAVRSLVDEHVAQILGYMRASRFQHGLLVNFGSPRFEIKKFIQTPQQMQEAATF